MIYDYFTFKDWVYDLNEEGKINWGDMKKAIETLKAKRELGIVKDHLPSYQVAQDPSSSLQRVNTLVRNMEPNVDRSGQYWEYEEVEVWGECPTWMDQTLGVPSTNHQCYKFPSNEKIVKVKSTSYVESLDSVSTEQIPSIITSGRGKEPILSSISSHLELNIGLRLISKMGYSS